MNTISWSSIYTLIFLSGALLFCQCKTKDTCNSTLGDTFQSVDIDTAFLDDSDRINVIFDWNTLEVLPDTYFADVSLLTGEKDRFNQEWINDHEKLESRQTSKMQLELILKSEVIPMVGNESEVHLHFRFPDRQNHIDCTHPGSGDAYFFDISFTISRATAAEFTISEIVWKEAFRAGGF